MESNLIVPVNNFPQFFHDSFIDYELTKSMTDARLYLPDTCWETQSKYHVVFGPCAIISFRYLVKTSCRVWTVRDYIFQILSGKYHVVFGPCVIIFQILAGKLSQQYCVITQVLAGRLGRETRLRVTYCVLATRNFLHTKASRI